MTIAKGNTHADGVKLADYLMMSGPGERAELLDMRGFATGDLRQAFADIEMVKEHATKADAALFHVQIRSAPGEGKKLTREQWLEIADGCDLALGREMTQQGRAAVLHIDEQTGDMHMHLAYDLIRQTDDGRAYVQKLGLFERKLQLYAREVELKYGLQILSNERNPGARRADRNELEESRRLDTDIHEIRTAIMQGFHSSDNGRSFDAAMQEQGYIVAGGDRNCYVVIDEQGGKQALNKKLTGMTLKEIDARLGDLDRASLPSVDQAKQMQLDRAAAREAHQAHERPEAPIGREKTSTSSHGPENAPQAAIKPLGQTAGEIRMAWQITKGRGVEAFAQEIENRGLILVHVSREEAAASYRAREYAKTINRQNRALKEGFAVVDQRGNVTKIDQRVTGDLWSEIEKRLGGIDKQELLTVDQAREAQREARQIEFAENKIAEREADRPATRLEQAIITADREAGRDDGKFAAELDKAGIALARVSAADIKALDALRNEQDIALMTATTEPNDPAPRTRIFAEVKEHDLCVVTKWGDVLPLNQQHIADLENRNFPTPATASPSSTELVAAGDDQKSDLNLPGVIEARALWEGEALMMQSYWQEISHARAADRENATARRVAIFDSGQAIEQQQAILGSVQEAKQGIIAAGGEAVERSVTVTSRLLDGLAAATEGVVNFLGDLWASPSKPTETELETRPKVAAERQQLRADIEYHELTEAVRDAINDARAKEQTERRAAPEYFRHIDREADRER
jgi:MobA/VirD2-like, nuclease domain